MLTGRQISHMSFHFFVMKDFQVRAVGFNDLLNVDINNDITKQFSATLGGT